MTIEHAQTELPNGHLFVGGAGGGRGIEEIDPIAKTKTLVETSSAADGIAISPDGSIVYGAINIGPGTGHVLGFAPLPISRSSIPGSSLVACPTDCYSPPPAR
jgi:hypothetical protein